MTATLKQLEIDEISLVDAGANPGANVVIVKRKSPDKPKLPVDKPVELTAQVNALINKLSAQVEKIMDDKFTSVAKRYEILGQKADELAPILKAAEAQDESLYNKIIGALDAALKVTEQAGVFGEVGKRGDGLKSNDIQKYAAQIRKNNPTMTFRQALEAAYQQHPELC